MSGAPGVGLAAGQAIEFRATAPITREQLRAYGEVAGDPNRIHLDDAVARASGLPGIIAHGMLTMAFIGERAVAAVREDPALAGYRLVSFQSRFKAMTLLGDVVSVGGTVKTLDAATLVLDLKAQNQRGELTTLGTARFQKGSGPRV